MYPDSKLATATKPTITSSAGNRPRINVNVQRSMFNLSGPSDHISNTYLHIHMEHRSSVSGAILCILTSRGQTFAEI
jgi:hypothetical protein